MEANMTSGAGKMQSLSLLLVILALIIWSAFQTVQLNKERQNLKTAFDNQEALITNAKNMRAQLDALAAGTKRLADQGNANAQMIVQQLAESGISINPNQQAAPAPR